MSKDISEITRRDIIDLFVIGLENPDDPLCNDRLYWSGRMDEEIFLSRLFELHSMPSTDGRYKDAFGDIHQHCTNNSDWDVDWIFYDSRFDLLHAEDEIFLNFLCEVFHPAVRLERQNWEGFLEEFNKLLKLDGFIIKESCKISGRSVYNWERLVDQNSVAGYPCLYLASDVELAWFESGMPRQFSYCNMLMNEVSDDPLKLINFSIRPVMLLSYINTELLNKRNKHESETPIYNLLLNYILTYPIAATCSVKVKDRNSKFVEEYIFPQLFMQWIRESNDFDGILYKSSLNTNLVSGMGAVNVAFPVKQFRGDGLDKRLCQKISISDIGYFDVGKYFERYQNILQEIIAYKNELQQFLIDTTFFDPSLVELIELCDCIVKTYTSLIEGEYKNSDLLFTHINSLCDHAESLYQNRSAVTQRCIVQSKPGQTLPINQDIIEKQFERFHELCGQVLHKHTVFHFNFEPVQNWEKI